MSSRAFDCVSRLIDYESYLLHYVAFDEFYVPECFSFLLISTCQSSHVMLLLSMLFVFAVTVQFPEVMGVHGSWVFDEYSVP
mgnify:FL=1